MGLKNFMLMICGSDVGLAGTQTAHVPFGGRGSSVCEPREPGAADAAVHISFLTAPVVQGARE